MTRSKYLRASQIASGVGVVFTLAWAATDAPWALWGAAGGVAAGFGLLLGAWLEVADG